MVRHFSLIASLLLASGTFTAHAAPRSPLQVAPIDTPAPIAAAITQLDSGRALSASAQLSGLLADGSYPDHALEIRYHLGRSLLALELPLSAQAEFVRVVRAGPESELFPYALSKLVVIAEQTGDHYDLRRIAAGLDPADVPAGARSVVAYHRARELHRTGELGAALAALDAVSPGSDQHAPALVLKGTILNTQQKYKSAVRAFRDVYRDEGADPALRDLALLDIARVYYGIERYAEAEQYYQLVARDSALWSTAVFERSWARLMQGDDADARGDLLTVGSPFFSERLLVPERALMGALMEYSRCDFASTIAATEQLKAEQAAVQAELSALLAAHSADGGAHAEAAWRHYFGDGEAVETALPDAFFAGALRDQALAGTARHLAALDAEQARIAAQRQDWRQQLGEALHDDLEARRLRLERRAGRLLLAEAAQAHRQLDHLLAQADLLKLDALNAQYDTYARRAESVPLPSAEDRAPRLYVHGSAVFIEEPFNGEFWEDELGYYRDLRPSLCE